MTVSLTGGLGNQMFQYAYGYVQAKKNDEVLKLDTFYMERDPNREYALGQYAISARKPGKWRGALYYTGRYLAAKIGREETWRYVLHIDYEEKEFTCRERKKGTFLSVGGFQNERYFADYRAGLLREFSYKGNLTDRQRELIGQMKNRCSVALHIRRGDYLSERYNNIYELPGRDYYERALAWLGERMNIDGIYVFSDDIDWCKAEYRNLESVTFVDRKISDAPQTDMELMRSCQHFIIANSTFSWWAAWLGEREDKVIIAPQKWFKVREWDRDVKTGLLQEAVLL